MMAKHRAVSPVGTALLAGAAPVALILMLATLAGCSRLNLTDPTPSASVPVPGSPTAVPSATPTVIPTPTPTPTPPALPTAEPTVEPTVEPTLEPVGPAYLTVIAGSEIIMDDGCFDYENTIAAANKAAKKHRKAAKQVGKSTKAAQALRERALWVDADNLADYNAKMLSVAQVALDQVSNGRSAEVGPLDQYLFDTIAFCGLADSHAAAQQQMLEVNTLAEKIRALAESALPDTT